MVTPINNITLIFDIECESFYYGKTRIKFNIELGHCPQNHAIKAAVIWEPSDHCQIFDVGFRLPLSY